MASAFLSAAPSSAALLGLGLLMLAALAPDASAQAPAASSAEGSRAQGSPPAPATDAFFGIALVYVKDWDRLREYEQRLGPLMQPYGVTMINQILPRSVSDAGLDRPDRIDVFYFRDPQDMERLFADPAVREAMAWRDAHATRKVIFLGGTPLFPLGS